MPDFSFHHLGVAVPDIAAALPHYERIFGMRLVDGPYDDPIQKVRVAFLKRDPLAPNTTDPCIELVAPLSPDAPVNRYLAKDAGAYHLCYEVGAVEEAISTMRTQGCLLVAPPAPAVAFGGRRIAWLFTPTRQLVELLERSAAPRAT